MIKSIMSSKELLILILIHKIVREEGSQKVGCKRVSLLNRKIKIRIKDHNLVKAKNNSRIIILKAIINKVKKIIVQYLKKMITHLIIIINVIKATFIKIMKVKI